MFIPSIKYKVLYTRTHFYMCLPWELPGDCRKHLDPYGWLSKRSLEISLDLDLHALLIL